VAGLSHLQVALLPESELSERRTANGAGVAMNAPVTAPAETEALHDLAWWAAERERAGTDRRGILLTFLRMLNVIEPCPVCGCESCRAPLFWQLASEADAKAAARRRDLNRLQGFMDDDLSLERAYEQMAKARLTPNATIEAVKQAVRDRGVSALDEKQTRERLERCNTAAIAEIDHWLLKRGFSG
jgi:hypothetical protein